MTADRHHALLTALVTTIHWHHSHHDHTRDLATQTRRRDGYHRWLDQQHATSRKTT